MSDDQIRRDMVNKISKRFEEVLQREAALLSGILPAAEMTLLLLDVARNVSLCAFLAGLQCRREEVDPAQLFDLLQQSLAERIANSREDALTMLSEIERQGAAA